MKQNKCFRCEGARIRHPFSICMTTSCSCRCVEQIYQMHTNGRKDDIKPAHPKFLKIDNAEIKELPNLDKDIKKFNEINIKEWIKTKKDRRFRKEKR